MTEKAQVFASLCRIGLTPQLAEEYFNSRLYVQKIAWFPHPVVYQNKKGEVEVLNDLDLNRRHEIYGVEIAGLKISKDQHFMYWSDACRQESPNKEKLPTTAQLKIMARHFNEINEAMAAFEAYGVKAEPINWTLYMSSETDFSMPMCLDLHRGDIWHIYPDQKYLVRFIL